MSLELPYQAVTNIIYIFSLQQYKQIIKIVLLEKGKPRESVGRKATGLNPMKTGHGSGVAKRMQHL